MIEGTKLRSFPFTFAWGMMIAGVAGNQNSSSHFADIGNDEGRYLNALSATHRGRAHGAHRKIQEFGFIRPPSKDPAPAARIRSDPCSPQREPSAVQESGDERARPSSRDQTGAHDHWRSTIMEIHFMSGQGRPLYRLGQAKFELWCRQYSPQGALRFNGGCPQSTQEGPYYTEYFVAYSGGKKVFESDGVYKPGSICAICEIFIFEYRNAKYIIVSDWTGGQKCCGQWYMFRLDRGELKPMEQVVVDSLNGFPSEINLEMRKGRLYLVLRDAIRWFYGQVGLYGYQYPLFSFHQHYAIKGDQLLKRDIDFQDEYRQRAQQVGEELEALAEKLQGSNEEDKPVLRPAGRWISLLGEKTVNLILAGEAERAWEEFDQTFNWFSTLSPPLNNEGEEIDPKKVREEILKALHRDLLRGHRHR